jgi:hypothetical protein
MFPAGTEDAWTTGGRDRPRTKEMRMTVKDDRDERDYHGPREVPGPGESRPGMTQFLGINIVVWIIVVVLAIAMLALILAYAL